MPSFIPRHIQTQLYQNLDSPEYLAIIGPRQAGKTTLLRKIKEQLIDRPTTNENQVQLLTFQDPQLLISFQKNPISFIKKYLAPSGKKTFLLIDEYQYAQDAGSKLKLIYDTIENLKIIITGSSALELKQISSQMVGRILRYQLNQLSYSEIIAIQNNFIRNSYQQFQTIIHNLFKKNQLLSNLPPISAATTKTIQPLFFDYTIYGSYPAVFKRQNPTQKQELLLNIYNTYVEKDVTKLLGLRKTEAYFKLIKYLAVTIGQQTNQSSLQRNLDLNFSQVESFLAALKHTYIIKEIKPFYKNKINEITKTPIYYFYDTGLRNWSLRSFQSLSNRTDVGHLVENFVLHRLQELVNHQLELTQIKYWRKNTGAQVDFIIEKLGQKPDSIPVEVKYQNFNRPTVSRSLRSFINQYHPQIGLVVTKNYLAQTKVNKTKILFMPVYLL